MDKKTKTTEKNLTVTIYLAHVVCLCWLIIFPLNTGACGWSGDGEHSDDDDDLFETEESTVLEEDELIINPAAQTKMGNLYRNGDGVAKDYVKAMYWYRKAANQGFVGAQNNLAVMYEQGLGVPKNKPEAIKWYQKAAEQNNAHAQHSIGVKYLDGDGIPQNFEEAAKWISRAAEQSHHSAFKDMGDIYWKGLGVPQNNIRAYMWWRLGVLHGDKESEKLLDIAAAKMNASRVAEAQKLAQEWMLKHK